ncbi:hypothetical protein AEA00_00375 [Xanthomonas campestris pv. campestris]|nr:hypothetical protein AEA00_00375 [Xanthomonas campestris pv. campestris]
MRSAAHCRRFCTPASDDPQYRTPVVARRASQHPATQHAVRREVQQKAGPPLDGPARTRMPSVPVGR